jgi:hypothetical protein
MTYASEIVNKRFIPNVVILFKGVYWAIRQPDSGLTVAAQRLAVEQVAINPTKVDPYAANTTINTYTFKLIDKDYAVTVLFDGVTKFFQNEQVSIWIGRCGVDMPFADYLKLPDTFVKSVSKDGSAYSFKTTEAKDRLNRPAFNEKNKLEVDIVIATTEIDAAVTIDPARFPAAGLIKIEDEFISYASLDLINNRFSGCIRGEKNSIPADHNAGATIFLVTEITENPVDVLLQCLISSGGGGAYDVLPDGAGVDETLINVTKFEQIRDEFFTAQTYELLLYGIDNILNYLEEEILFPNELRIISDNTSKISLVILNRKIFDDDQPVINHDTIIKQPAYEVTDSEIINVVEVEYDFSEGSGKYRKLIILEDADSITDFGKRDALSLKLKGVQQALDGANIATDIAQRFLNRFSYPKPEISFSTHLDKSLILLGDKPEVVSATLPSDTGELNFAESLEVIERGINWKTGDVKFKVAFTSFTGIRECYLAPSDTVVSFTTQKSLTVGSGRGALYRPGWKMRLYDNTARDYADLQVNEISTVVGDVVTFVDDWTTTLLNTVHRIMFCDYDDAVDSQKRYCFISDDGLNFMDGRKSFQITL